MSLGDTRPVEPLLRRAAAALGTLWIAAAALAYFGVYLWNAAVHWLKLPEALGLPWRE